VCYTYLNDLMIIDGRYEHNHGEPDDRTVQRLKVRQECKHPNTGKLCAIVPSLLAIVRNCNVITVLI
jgi:hypothetical protein